MVEEASRDHESMPNVRRRHDGAALPHEAEPGLAVPFLREHPNNNLPLDLASFVGREREIKSRGGVWDPRERVLDELR